ncbi:MAG: CAP domain-containing protein [bacterium]
MFKKITFFILLNLLAVNIVHAKEDIASRLRGQILLQVEEKGAAWYVNPANLKRYYLGGPADAFRVMRELSIGILNKDLEKIPVADANLLSGVDIDGDGISDAFEDSIGTDKNSTDTDGDGFSDKEELLNGGLSHIDKNFAAIHAGKIFLQVENKGETWYVNKTDLKRYYLGRPADAFNVMRSLSLGITNADLDKISIAGVYNSPPPTAMEKSVQDLINKQREANGLKSLKWNDDLAGVAREHSANLAKENVNLIDYNVKCSLPTIHHEGFDFGLYSQNRLKSRQIYYLSANAENIALIPEIVSTKYHIDNNPTGAEIADCADFFNKINSDFKIKLESDGNEEEKKTIVQDEINYRQGLVAGQSKIDVVEVNRKNSDEVENEAVVGWMNSPGHRKNILTAQYDEAGVGIAEVNDYFILTQVFITRAKCGYFGGPCCEGGGCYQPLKCSGEVCAE